MNTLNNILWISIIQIILTEISATPLQRLTMPASRSKRESEILFPDEETIFIPSAGESVPKCAQGSTFCEAIDDYPSAYVDLILEKDAHKYEELFGADLVMPDTLLNRFDGFDVEESLCRSQERLIYPRAGLTQDNTWMYIVNQNNYTQGVRVDECIGEHNVFHNMQGVMNCFDTKTSIFQNKNQGDSSGAKISIFSPELSEVEKIRHMNQCEMTQNFPFGYDAVCKQKYIYRQLLAINENGNTVKDLFRLPSCCQCVLIQTDRKRRSLH